MSLRIAMIGAGPFNRAHHMPALRRITDAAPSRVSLAAICDLDAAKADRFVSDFGFAAGFTDLHQMIRQVQPDAVYVLVTPIVAADVIGQVLPYGLPLFTEKPPGVTVEQAERVAGLASQHGNLTYVAFNRRQAPVMLKLHQWLTRTPAVRHIRASLLRTNRREPEFPTGTAIHALDALRFLAGNVEAIDTRAYPYPGDVCRDFHVRLCFESGLSAELDVIVDSGLQRERYAVFAEGRTAEATIPGGYSSAHFAPGFRVHEGRQIVIDAPATTDGLVEPGFLGEHEAFLAALEQGLTPNCTLQDAQHSVRLASAVNHEYSGKLSEFHEPARGSS